MIVYIAGKMTGLPDLGRQAFEDVEKMLKDGGYDVINPAILPEFLDRKQRIPICLAMIDAADAVYALSNWEDSIGARLEVEYAKIHEKKIMYQYPSIVEKHKRWRDAKDDPPQKGEEVIVMIEDYSGDRTFHYTTHALYIGNNEWIVDNDISDWVILWKPFPELVKEKSYPVYDGNGGFR